jgi:hypothetical protein
MTATPVGTIVCLVTDGGWSSLDRHAWAALLAPEPPRIPFCSPGQRPAAGSNRPFGNNLPRIFSPWRMVVGPSEISR